MKEFEFTEKVAGLIKIAGISLLPFTIGPERGQSYQRGSQAPSMREAVDSFLTSRHKRRTRNNTQAAKSTRSNNGWAAASARAKTLGGGFKNLNDAISRRGAKGSAGYAAAQNYINKAYGSKVRHTVSTPKTKATSQSIGKSLGSTQSDIV